MFCSSAIFANSVKYILAFFSKKSTTIFQKHKNHLAISKRDCGLRTLILYNWVPRFQNYIFNETLKFSSTDTVGLIHTHFCAYKEYSLKLHNRLSNGFLTFSYKASRALCYLSEALLSACHCCSPARWQGRL